MELANKCYECKSFGNMGDGKSIYGYCHRVDDCCGPTYTVEKEQTKCIFTNPGEKMSLEKISERDKRELKGYNSIQKAAEDAKRIIESWPKWKQELAARCINIPKYPYEYLGWRNSVCPSDICRKEGFR